MTNGQFLCILSVLEYTCSGLLGHLILQCHLWSVSKNSILYTRRIGVIKQPVRDAYLFSPKFD